MSTEYVALMELLHLPQGCVALVLHEHWLHIVE